MFRLCQTFLRFPQWSHISLLYCDYCDTEFRDLASCEPQILATQPRLHSKAQPELLFFKTAPPTWLKPSLPCACPHPTQAGATSLLCLVTPSANPSRAYLCILRSSTYLHSTQLRLQGRHPMSPPSKSLPWLLQVATCSTSLYPFTGSDLTHIILCWHRSLKVAMELHELHTKQNFPTPKY